jgi:hypothetical protein
MMLEAVTAFVTLAVGVLALHAAGLRGWALGPLGYIVGASGITVLATVAASFGLPISPALVHPIALAAAALVWVRSPSSSRDRRNLLLSGALAFLLLVPVVWVLRAARIARVTPDSYNLLMSGSLMHQGRLSEAPPLFLESWQVAMGALHGPANLQGELFLHSAMPLLALALLLALFWFVQQTLLGAGQTMGIAGATATLAAVLLLTTNRYLYNALYLNRHLMIATFLLVAAIASWGLVRRSVAAPPVLMVLLATALPALAITRAETPVLAGLVALPLLTHRVPRRQRVVALLAVGLPVVAWNTHLLARYAGTEQSSLAATVMLLLGALALVAAALVALGWQPADPLPRWLVPLAEVALWLALLGAAVREPPILIESLRNTALNVAFDHGGWGVTLVALAFSAAAVLVLTREGDRVLLRFPMTTFLPFALLLAYLRTDGGLPYRDGVSDSLNRMLFHLVPLAIFYVATSASASLRGGRAEPDPVGAVTVSAADPASSRTKVEGS